MSYGDVTDVVEALRNLPQDVRDRRLAQVDTDISALQGQAKNAWVENGDYDRMRAWQQQAGPHLKRLSEERRNLLRAGARG